MKIKLQNFANIESIDFELENSKINFLFGLSGAGKSSIAKSLSTDDKSNYVKAGKRSDDCVVTISDAPYLSSEDVAIYDYDFMNDVLIVKGKMHDIYKILFSDNDKISMYKNEFTSAVGKLFVSKDKIRDLVSQIISLEKSLSLKFTSKNNYYAKCVVEKFQKTIFTKKDNTLAKKYGWKMAQWFVDGKNTNEYINGKCPFCGRKLSNYRIAIVESITNIDIKSYDKIKAILPQIPDLNIVEPEWNSVRSTNKFKTKLHDLLEIKDELVTILDAIDAAGLSEYNPNKVKRISISKKTKMFFPQIAREVDNYNLSLKSLSITYSKLISESNRVLRKNVSLINLYLERFNIPYTFINIATDRSNEISGYCLKHIDDSKNVSDDRTEWLSFGEKNIIGLILFLLINSQKKMIIIDDPAGSFDNYRRKTTLDFIFESKSDDSTILLLSHDEVFIKIALYYASKNRKKYLSNANLSAVEKKYAKEIGKTQFIESGSNHALVDISENDFGVYSDFIKDKLSEYKHEINHQTAILIRALFESKRKSSKMNATTYEYLSAIIHQTNYDEIIDYVTNKQTTEKCILDHIFSITGISYSPIPIDYLSKIGTYYYSDFETLVLCREELKGTKDVTLKSILNEMNSIIHQSSTYITCLNPFKYKMYSSKTQEYIDDYKKKFLSMSTKA